MAESNEIKLKVGELTGRDDFGKGIVRMDSKSMKDLGIREGDTVELEGERKTVAVTLRAYPVDVGLTIVRMDGLVRKNAGVSIGENVTIRKIDIKEAKTITLAPAQKDIIIRVSGDIIKRSMIMRPVNKGDVIIPSPMFRRRGSSLIEDFFNIDMEDMFFPGLGMETRFVVVSTTPSGPVRIMEDTEVIVSERAVEMSEERIPEVTYEDIGGLTEEVNKVREMIELPLKHPELFERLGVEPPKGVLLYGPPGTGKTLLAKAVANEVGSNFVTINGPEIMSKWYGESEKKLRQIFEDAEKNAPTIIFIDEIDAIAPKREEVTGEVERRVVSQLLTLMDGLKSRGKVIVIAATNRPNSIDQALRRGGRFDRELEISVPNKQGRKEIMQIHTRNMPLTEDVDIDQIAEITYGFVGADLQALTKEAAMSALRKVLPEISEYEEEGPLPEEVLEKLQVTGEDFDHALRMVQPSAMREVMIEVPKVKWTDIGGLKTVKQEMQEAIEWPLKHPDSFKRLGIHPPLGILLYGPPGTGKTQLAKAVASESSANFISIKGPELLSKYVGESEKHLRDVFRRAKQVAPCIIFFDEIDSMAPRRGLDTGEKSSERLVSQMLTEMSGLEDLHDVVVIAATNRPDIMEPALLRPGRFDRQIYVGPPDYDARAEIFRVHTKDMPLAKDVSIEDLAGRTEGYSGADIQALVREAGMEALRENLQSKEVKMKHFEHGLGKIKPSITEDMKKHYNAVVQRLKEVEREIPTYLG